MIVPSFLKTGDRIHIIATGRKTDPESVHRAVHILEAWGLQVTTGDFLISTDHSYLSASDEHRLADLQQAFNDPTIKAILCARGGYGTTRILDNLDFSLLKKYPKWIIGFSDITALHLLLYKNDIPSIHGTMPILFSAKEKSSLESLRHVLFGESVSIHTESSPQNSYGDATGHLIGGNLSLIVDSLGTSSQPDFTHSILVLEEIDEFYYKIDRMLTQLKRAGVFQKLNGLILGHFTNIHNSDLAFGETIEAMIARVIGDRNIPIAFNFPIGHAQPNLAWRHGVIARLRVTQTESILTQ